MTSAKCFRVTIGLPAAALISLTVACSGGKEVTDPGPGGNNPPPGGNPPPNNPPPTNNPPPKSPVTRDTSFGPGGGTLGVTSDGSAYKGFELVIPSGAFESASEWTIHEDTLAPLPPLPAGVARLAPNLIVSNSQGRSSRLITLRVPVTRRAGYVPAAIFYDPVRGVVEPLPIIGGDANSLLIGVSHLNPDLMLENTVAAAASAARTPAFSLRKTRPSSIRRQPDGAAPAPTSPALSIGAGQLIPLEIPRELLEQLTIGFDNLKDAWPIAELGSFAYPQGHGFGGALLTILYKAQQRIPSLATLVKASSVPGLHVDSVTLAAVMAMARRYEEQGLKIAPVFNDIGVKLGPLSLQQRDSLTDMNLRLGLFFTKLPQLIGFFRNSTSAAFPSSEVGFGAAYAAEPNQIQYSAPWAGAGGAVSIGSGGFLSRLFRSTGDGPPLNAERITALIGSFLAPVENYTDILQNMFDAAIAQSSAARQSALAQILSGFSLPDVKYELRNSEADDWIEVSDTAVVRNALAAIRAICRTCTGLLPQDENPEVQELVLVDPVTLMEIQRGTGGGISLGGLLGPMASGATARMLSGVLGRMQVFDGVGGILGRSLGPLIATMKKDFTAIAPDTQTIAPGEEATFTIQGSSANLMHEWDFGDESPKLTTPFSQPEVKHTYDEEGTYTVTATLLFEVAGETKRVVSATATVIVRDPNSWRLTSLNGAAPAWTPVSIATQYNALAAFFQQIGGDPSNGVLRYDAALNRVTLAIDPEAPAAATFSSDALVPNQVLLGSTASNPCNEANTVANSSDAGSGLLTGKQVHSCAVGVNQVVTAVRLTLSATKNGDQLSGTITAEFQDFDGHVETEIIDGSPVSRFFIDNILESRTVVYQFTAER
jgi:PKD repeat protein